MGQKQEQRLAGETTSRHFQGADRNQTHPRELPSLAEAALPYPVLQKLIVQGEPGVFLPELKGARGW